MLNSNPNLTYLTTVGYYSSEDQKKELVPISKVIQTKCSQERSSLPTVGSTLCLSRKLVYLFPIQKFAVDGDNILSTKDCQ
jgi:hypothetical protein